MSKKKTKQRFLNPGLNVCSQICSCVLFIHDKVFTRTEMTEMNFSWPVIGQFLPNQTCDWSYAMSHSSLFWDFIANWKLGSQQSSLLPSLTLWSDLTNYWNRFITRCISSNVPTNNIRIEYTPSLAYFMKEIVQWHINTSSIFVLFVCTVFGTTFILLHHFQERTFIMQLTLQFCMKYIKRAGFFFVSSIIKKGSGNQIIFFRFDSKYQCRGMKRNNPQSLSSNQTSNGPNYFN